MASQDNGARASRFQPGLPGLLDRSEGIHPLADVEMEYDTLEGLAKPH